MAVTSASRPLPLPFPLLRMPILRTSPLQLLPGKPLCQGFISHYLQHRPKGRPRPLHGIQGQRECESPTDPWGMPCTPCSGRTDLPGCSLELALDGVSSLAPSLSSGCSFCLECLLCLVTTAQEETPCPSWPRPGHLCSGAFHASSALVQHLAHSRCLLSDCRRERTRNYILFLALLKSVAGILGKPLCLLKP